MAKIKRTFSPGSYDLRLKRSRTGLGVFTFTPIPKGACIIEYIGKPVSKEQFTTNEGRYLFWTSRSSMIDGNIRSNKARFVNHSCAPNCEIDIRSRRIYIFAKRNIKVGEELNYDYDEEYFDMYIKPKGCLCRKCDPRG